MQGDAFGEAGMHPTIAGTTTAIPQLHPKGGDPRMSTPLHPLDPEAALRARILERAKAINETLLARLKTVADDLDAGGHLAALGGIGGIEREVERMRSFLLLLR